MQGLHGILTMLYVCFYKHGGMIHITFAEVCRSLPKLMVGNNRPSPVISLPF